VVIVNKLASLLIVGVVAILFMLLLTNAANRALDRSTALMEKAYWYGCVYGVAMERGYHSEPTTKELTACENSGKVFLEGLNNEEE
jgi:Flp pilus assembly protein protease CpaA